MIDCPCINCPCIPICRLRYYSSLVVRCELIRNYVVYTNDVFTCRTAIMKAINPTEWKVDERGEFIHD